MAVRYAVATGPWSSTSTWNSGNTLGVPGPSDDVYSNNFIVTIDTTPITVLSISNASVASPVVVLGGRFVPTDGITLTCTATDGVRTAVQIGGCFISSLITGQSCTIVANANIGTYSGIGGVIINNGTGTLYFRGSVVAQGTDGGITLSNSSSGVLDVTGNLSVLSSNCCAIIQRGGGIVNFTGSSAGGSQGVLVNSTIINMGSGTVIVTGTCSGGGATAALSNRGTGTIFVYGPIIAGGGAPGLVSSSTSANVILSGPFLTSTNGTHAIYCACWFWANANVIPTRYEIRTANLTTIRPLYTADSVGGNPAITNVRSGTIYGPSSELTGTMAVPPADSVNFGVPVDNTTGTALVTASSVANAIWNHPISGITTSGSIGERLKNTATVDAVNTILSNGLR
jgi:hypothetical protein